MRMSADKFRKARRKAVTLMGMSGVGKTVLANRLPETRWFIYSGDYRIGTQYLREPILDNIKLRAMEVPFLHDLLRSDSIYIESNITVHNLRPISTFLGKPGDPRARRSPYRGISPPPGVAPPGRGQRHAGRGVVLSKRPSESTATGIS